MNEVLTDMTGGLKKNESNIDLDNEESFRHMVSGPMICLCFPY